MRDRRKNKRRAERKRMMQRKTGRLQGEGKFLGENKGRKGEGRIRRRLEGGDGRKKLRDIESVQNSKLQYI